MKRYIRASNELRKIAQDPTTKKFLESRILDILHKYFPIMFNKNFRFKFLPMKWRIKEAELVEYDFYGTTRSYHSPEKLLLELKCRDTVKNRDCLVVNVVWKLDDGEIDSMSEFKIKCLDQDSTTPITVVDFMSSLPNKSVDSMYTHIFEPHELSLMEEFENSYM